MEEKYLYAILGFGVGTAVGYFMLRGGAAPAVRRVAARRQVGVPWRDYIPNSFMFGPTPPQWGYAREVETTPAQPTYG